VFKRTEVKEENNKPKRTSKKEKKNGNKDFGTD
jgi:hypothetical protein